MSRTEVAAKFKLKPDDDLPNNVCNESQLSLLPPECLSSSTDDDGHANYRPLRHVDDLGHEYHYALKPMTYSVCLILLVELMERFSFYGVYYTQTLYLTGAYNRDWNAGMTSVEAASFVSVSTAVAYTTPFIGAYLADSVLGDYKSILYGSLFLYLPGVLLIALTTVPHLFDADEFNRTALTIGLTFLWPFGTGIVKSVVNVFGARNFHPILQSSMIESYYVNFYVSINIGALAGIILVPMVAQHNVTLAYFCPFTVLALALIIFVLGTPRYVRSRPRGDLFRQDKSSGNNSRDTISLFTIFRINLLIVPFCIAYSQMPTTFIVQGTVMHKAFGFIDAAMMSMFDAFGVLLTGYLTGNKIYPILAARGIKIPTTTKFAIGSALASAAILWALFVEHKIHKAYERDGSQICVLWQVLSYFFIGWGEIFAVSAAYEAAFSASPPEKKALASALNIFCIGGIPNVFCIMLYRGCKQWFTNSRGNANISKIEDYATARVANYFWVLFGVLVFGTLVCLVPRVRNFVASVEDRAAELIKTPVMRKQHPGADEESPLLGTAKQRQYLKKYGRGPVLFRLGSFRAGASLSRRDLQGGKSKKVKYKYIPRLYRGDNNNESQPGTPQRIAVLTGPGGKPIRAGDLDPPQVAPSSTTKHSNRFSRHEST